MENKSKTITKFRINAKKFALTYPNAKDITKEDIRERLTEIIGDENLKEYFIVQEEHKDGTPHFHAFIETNRRMNIINCKFFDIKQNHGNYKTCTNRLAWLNYLKKSDDDPLTNINEIGTPMEERNKLLFDIAIKQGAPKLLEEGKVSLKDYSFIVRSLEIYLSQKTIDNRLDLPLRLPHSWSNIDLIVDLKQKRCNFWIWSQRPNAGKTTFLREIYAKFKAEFWNMTESFQNQIRIETQIILMDEFRRGSLKLSTLNTLADGTYLIPRKSLPALKLTMKPLILICSNTTPEGAYNAALADFIEARFDVILVD